MIRDFHLGDILSITTGALVSPRGMEGIYEILNFLTGDNLFTHQLPRALQEMQPRLLAQHPQLRDVDASGVDRTNHEAWLREQVERFGETLPVRSEHQFHELRDPVEELEEKIGPERVVTVRMGP